MGWGVCSPGVERRSRLAAPALRFHHCGARDHPVVFYPDVADHGPVLVERGLPLLCPLFLKEFGVLYKADEVSCLILVGYVYPQFFGGVLVLVERSGLIT